MPDYSLDADAAIAAYTEATCIARKPIAIGGIPMMIECPECKKSVSDSAEVCPGCGYRLLGRENMVYCPRCKTEVIPKFRPRDTISKWG